MAWGAYMLRKFGYVDFLSFPGDAPWRNTVALEIK